jgi:hypothetical protein
MCRKPGAPVSHNNMRIAQSTFDEYEHEQHDLKRKDGNPQGRKEARDADGSAHGCVAQARNMHNLGFGAVGKRTTVWHMFFILLVMPAP